MLKPCLKDVTTKNESYYSIVMGVAKRAREISDELVSQNKVLEEKPVKTAVNELFQRKFSIIEGSADDETVSADDESVLTAEV